VTGEAGVCGTCHASCVRGFIGRSGLMCLAGVCGTDSGGNAGLWWPFNKIMAVIRTTTVRVSSEGLRTTSASIPPVITQIAGHPQKRSPPLRWSAFARTHARDPRLAMPRFPTPVEHAVRKRSISPFDVRFAYNNPD
jgi:hypothetical protein